MVRTFIAIDLPKEAKLDLKRIQDLIKKQSFMLANFTEIQNLHLTLKFLGEISEEQILEVKKRLKEIKFNDFEVRLSEIGVFSKDYIRIIWVKLSGEALFRLQKEVDEKLKDLFPIEERFMSHITIARVKQVNNKQEVIMYLNSLKPKKIKFLINEFSLKKSELKPQGPVYLDIEEYLSV